MLIASIIMQCWGSLRTTLICIELYTTSWGLGEVCGSKWDSSVWCSKITPIICIFCDFFKSWNGNSLNSYALTIKLSRCLTYKITVVYTAHTSFLCSILILWIYVPFLVRHYLYIAQGDIEVLERPLMLCYQQQTHRFTGCTLSAQPSAYSNEPRNPEEPPNNMSWLLATRQDDWRNWKSKLANSWWKNAKYIIFF